MRKTNSWYITIELVKLVCDGFVRGREAKGRDGFRRGKEAKRQLGFGGKRSVARWVDGGVKREWVICRGGEMEGQW